MKATACRYCCKVYMAHDDGGNFCAHCGFPTKPLSEIPPRWVESLQKQRPEFFEMALGMDAQDAIEEATS